MNGDPAKRPGCSGMKHHELLWGTALVAFIAWVFLAPDPSVRISRACRPLHWASNGVVSLTALTAPKYEVSAQNGGNRVVYGCEYSVWRLFYQHEYDAALAAKREQLFGARPSPAARCVAKPAETSGTPAGAHPAFSSCANKSRPVVSRPPAQKSTS